MTEPQPEPERGEEPTVIPADLPHGIPAPDNPEPWTEPHKEGDDGH